MTGLNAMERMFSAPLPEKTDSYTPIAHETIDKITRTALQEQGFVLSKTFYRSSTDGRLGQAEYHINYGDDPEMGLMIAWQNSYNKLISFKYAIGAHVMVCSNGAVSGDIGAYKRKHTGTADEEAASQIKYYLQNAKQIFLNLVRDREHLKKIDLSPERMAEIIGRMFIHKEIITSTQINIMKREMETPSFDYGVPVHNAWSLYNFATHAFKEDSPRNWISRHIDLHSFFGEEFGLERSEELPEPVQPTLFPEEATPEETSQPLEEVMEEVPAFSSNEERDSDELIDLLEDF